VWPENTPIDTEPRAFFVYGTLKRGEMNHSLLAPYALSIEPAWMPGRLYDVGDFPALAPGSDHVRGEIVRLDAVAMERVLPVIDRLEGYESRDESNSLYFRRPVEVTTSSGVQERAYAYFYNPAHPAMPALETLPHLASGEWNGPPLLSELENESAFDDYREWVRTFTHQNASPDSSD
jgi:gamma-glutamylcyclotransferase (GGCT)/AIG2-like uncharacterized protein YtfP